MQGGRYGSPVRYGVFPVADAWALCCNGLRLKRYADRLAALSAAEAAARQAIGGGFVPELYIYHAGEVLCISPACTPRDGVCRQSRPSPSEDL